MSPRTSLRAALLFCAALIFVATGRAAAQCAPDTLQVILDNPAPTQDDWFGDSVAISGGLAVVGSTLDDPGGVSNTGRAWVFNATTGALVATLNNPSGAAGEEFGNSAAISGNLAVIGAYSADQPGAINVGKAYVFNATTGALVATLTNPSPTVEDWFGWSVAISGNVAVVGTFRDDPGGVINAGTAYVFNATTGALVATLTNPSPTVEDRFGYSVAVSGGIAVVGAHFDDPGGVGSAGTAYVFNASTGVLVATLNNPTPAVSDQFGWSVAISGGVAVVGANGDDPGGVGNAGTAYVFNANTGALVATLNNPAPAFGDLFGQSVAISGTFVVVGAYGDDPGGVGDAGTVYGFNALTGAHLATIDNPAPEASDWFGNSVAISGTFAVVGAHFDAPGGVSNAGTAYVFSCTPPTPTASPTPSATPSATPSPTASPTATPTPSPTEPCIPDTLRQTLDNPAPDPSDSFGISVAVSGNVAVVGAHFDSSGGVSIAGAAFVLDAETGALITSLNNPSR